MQVINKLLILFSLVVILSCNNDESDPVPSGKYEQGVLISNEGNFSDVDGSSGYYDLEVSTYAGKIFEEENNRLEASAAYSI